jgi:hypothetical protein
MMGTFGFYSSGQFVVHLWMEDCVHWIQGNPVTIRKPGTTLWALSFRATFRWYFAEEDELSDSKNSFPILNRLALFTLNDIGCSHLSPYSVNGQSQPLFRPVGIVLTSSSVLIQFIGT